MIIKKPDSTCTAMSYTNKTQPTAISPDAYLQKNMANKPAVQAEAKVLIDLYAQATGWPAVMWNKIFGFGKYFYQDSKGGEHEYLASGFTISTTGFTLYNLLGWKAYEKEIANLGKHKFSGKSCLNIKSITDIDLAVLAKVIKLSVIDLKKKYRVE